MTVNELVEIAKRRLSAGESQSPWPNSEIDLRACVSLAKNAVAHAVMRDSSRRGLLQQVYSVSLDAAGEGDLLAATGSITGNAGEIIVEGVRFGLVVDLDGNVLQPLWHYADFVRPQPTVYPYYLIKNKATIATRALGVAVNGPNEIQGASGPLSITASFEPDAIDDFPPETEPDLVEELCRQVTIKVAPANANR